MATAAAAPTTSATSANRTWAMRLASCMATRLPAEGGSECLPDAEVHAPLARLQHAVYQQPGNGIQLIPEVEADGPDRRGIPQPGSDRVPQIVQVDAPRSGPDVARIEKGDATDV